MKHQLKVLVYLSFSKDVSMTPNKFKVLPQTYLLISISHQVGPSIAPKAVNENLGLFSPSPDLCLKLRKVRCPRFVLILVRLHLLHLLSKYPKKGAFGKKDHSLKYHKRHSTQPNSKNHNNTPCLMV